VAIISLANSPPSRPTATVTVSPGSSRCQPGGAAAMAPKYALSPKTETPINPASTMAAITTPL